MKEHNRIFTNEYDDRTALFTIQVSNGGVDVTDWAEQLERMYFRFFEDRGFTIEYISCQPGDLYGIKSSVYRVTGTDVYKHLKSESGIHQSEHTSRFEPSGKLCKPFVKVKVYPDIADEIDVEIDSRFLTIDRSVSTGPGATVLHHWRSAITMLYFGDDVGASIKLLSQKPVDVCEAWAWKLLKLELHKNRLMYADDNVRCSDTISGEWGNKVRKYISRPYKMVEDLRTNHRTEDVASVLDGDLMPFVEAFWNHRVLS